MTWVLIRAATSRTRKKAAQPIPCTMVRRCGGAYASPALIAAASDVLGIRIRHVYGSTEFGLALGNMADEVQTVGGMHEVAGVRARLEPLAGYDRDGLGHLVLTYTRFGRYIYMTGGNREAAEYSGVNVKFIIGSVMVISAMCSGIAGMLAVAYFGSAQQNQFDSYLLDAIAAVVVGGTSLFGGRGGIGNTIIGLLVLGVLNNGLDHVQIDSFLKILIRGLILLSALIINVYAQRLKESE